MPYAGQLRVVTEDDAGASHRSGTACAPRLDEAYAEHVQSKRLCYTCCMQAATVALMLGSTYFATAAVRPAEQQQSKALRPPS